MHLLRKHTARLRPVRLFMWDERNGFDMTILVIDGQGGKLGKRLVESIKKSFPQVEVMAVGTNSAASESMMRAGADRVATGENPVIVASRTAQIIVGPMGIALADALMGEISPAMANAVAASAAYRVLIPMNLCDTYVAGVSQKSSAIMDDAMEHIRQLLTEMGLPFLTGQIPEIGSMLCPMHIPALLCGFVCGWPWGLAVGFVSPLLRSLLFGMPTAYTAAAMAFELAAYGAVSGILYRIFPRRNWSVYVTLIAAMIVGRLVWGGVQFMMAGLQHTVFDRSLFLAGAVTNALPGILVQIILIPILVITMEKAKLTLNGTR